MIYEYRCYWVAPGRMADMQARFATINLPLFERYGIRLEKVLKQVEHLKIVDGTLSDAPPPSDEFHFVVSFPDREAQATAWKKYHEDPLFMAGREAQAGIMKVVEIKVFEEARRS